MGRRLAYLSLEAPRPGQASYTHVHEMVAELRELGWSIELFLGTVGGASTNAPWRRRLSDYLRVQAHLAGRLRRFDAIYSRAHPMAAPLALLAMVCRVPVVHEINGRPEDLVVTYPRLAKILPALRLLQAVQMRRADHLFAVTEGLGGWAADVAGHHRVSVVPNGANTRLFRPEGSKADLGYPYVVFVGGLVAWHGISTMMTATQLDAWPKDIRLVVIGDGPERDRLSGCDAARITWLGRVPYELVPDYLRGSIAALCMIEDPEGRSSTGVAPLKLFEAMACAVPVLASDLPFQGDLVRKAAAGDVIPAGDAPGLAAAVRRLAEEPENARSLGMNGARYVQSTASWRARARQTSRVLDEICAGSASKSI